MQGTARDRSRSGSGRVGPMVAALLLLSSSAAIAAEDVATLARSARDNPTIKFDAAHGELAIGHLYEGDLNKGQGYREVFRLQLRRGDAAVFDVSSKIFDPALQLISEAGEVIAADDDGGPEAPDSRLVVATPDGGGTFYLVVSSADQRGGNFDLKVSPRRASRPRAPGRIEPGSPARGAFDRNSPLRVEEQQIYSSYVFEGMAGERVQIEGKARLTDIDLELLQGATVLNTRDVGGTNDPALYHTLASTGQYRINVLAPPESTDSFEILVKKLPPPKPAPPPKAITVGQALQDEFLADSPVVNPGSNRPYALYEIRGNAGEVVELTAALADAAAPRDARLGLEAGIDTAAGFATVRTPLLPSERVPGGRRMILTFERSGSLLVRVTGESGATGRFTLTSRHSGPEGGAPAGVAPK